MTLAATPTCAVASNDQLAWGNCCLTDPQTILAERSFPWFRMAVGLFVAAQTMLIGLAINLAPPEDAATRQLLQGAMGVASTLVLFLLGWPMLVDARAAIARRSIRMELLFLLGVAGSWFLSVWAMWRGDGAVYFEVPAVLMIVYSIGRSVSVQSRAVAFSAIRRFTQSLSVAQRITLGCDASREVEHAVPVDQVRVGDRVRIRPGQSCPVDGIIVAGCTLLRDTPFTGRLMPRAVRTGDHILAGSVCLDGTIDLCAQSGGTMRRVDELVSLLQQTVSQRSPWQRQADLLVAWFLPLTAALALLAGTYWAWQAGPQRGIEVFLAVILVACPCAAGLATPLVLWNVMGVLAQRGLIVREGDAIERLAQADSVIFDKTGTLGSAEWSLDHWEAGEIPAPDAYTLAIVAAVEKQSDHPVAKLLSRLPVPADAPPVKVGQASILPGQGVQATVRVEDKELEVCLRRDPDEAAEQHRVLIEIDGRMIVAAVVRETLRDSAADALSQLARMGMPAMVMTGDASGSLLDGLPIQQTHTRLSPHDKHALLEKWTVAAGGAHRPVFVGDGFNDTPALARAHVGIALAQGSDVAVASAALTLHGGDLTLVPKAITLARQAHKLIRSNLAWAVSYNLLGMMLAAAGFLHPILAALLMALSSGVVSYRSLHLDGLETWDQPNAESNDSLEKGNTSIIPEVTGGETKAVSRSGGALAWTHLLHAAGFLGQAWILAMLANLSGLGTLALLGGAGMLTMAVVRYGPRLPAWADMTASMLSLGGLGMNLGWWWDAGFAPVSEACKCCAAASEPSSVAWGLLSGMNLGMLALGVPAMLYLRYTPQPWNWRRWCCTGMLLVGLPGMTAGMIAGSALARIVLTEMPPPWPVLGDGWLMLLGMGAGMWLPHALEYALPLRRMGMIE